MRRASRILIRYVLLEALPLVLLCFGVLTVLITAQQLSRQSTLALLGLATPAEMAYLTMLVLPGVCLITLPMALLMGMMMALNRLKADMEISSAQACGLSPTLINLPLIILGLASTLLAFYLTLDIIPTSSRRLLDFRSRILSRTLTSRIKAQSFETRFPGYLLYIRNVDSASGDWQGVFLLTEREPVMAITAASGRLRLVEEPELVLEVELSEGVSYSYDEETGSRTGAVFDKSTIRLSALKEFSADEPSQASRLQALPTRALYASVRSGTDRPTLLEWHKRISLPLASIVLTWIAIAIALRAQKPRSRAIGIALGFAISLLYYLCLVAGQNLAATGALPVWIGIWAPNLLGILFASSALIFRFRLDLARRRVAPAQVIEKGQTAQGAEWRWGLLESLNPLKLTDLVNYLIFSQVMKAFLLGLSVLVLTTLIFTLFDIIPSVARRQAGAGFVATYLIFLSPQILYYTAPFALLIASLVAYFLLSRSNQLIALYGSGISTLRLAAPVTIISLALGAALFLLSETLLPRSNREQDARYQQLKGRKGETATLALGRRWILASGGRIIGFLYDDGSKKLLKTTVYQLSQEPPLLERVIEMEEAYTTGSRRWRVGRGWGFTPRSGEFGSLDGQEMDLGEDAAAFRRTVNEASKLSSTELRSYIAQLERVGVPSHAERVDLGKKYSHPLACLTLLLLALPFAASRHIHSRREGLSGIGYGIVIGLLFWLLSQALELAGKEALLPVWIAVWGSHLLSLPLSLYLLLLRRH